MTTIYFAPFITTAIFIVMVFLFADDSDEPQA